MKTRKRINTPSLLTRYFLSLICILKLAFIYFYCDFKFLVGFYLHVDAVDIFMIGPASQCILYVFTLHHISTWPLKMVSNTTTAIKVSAPNFVVPCYFATYSHGHVLHIIRPMDAVHVQLKGTAVCR
jgi:hypothetical protein